MSDPRFRPQKFGYDMQQVDAYVDQLRTENKKLSKTNEQFLHLYLTGQITEEAMADYTRGQIIEQRNLNDLLRTSLHHRQRRYPNMQNMEFPIKRRNIRVGSIFFHLFFVAVILASATLAFGAYLFSTSDPTAPPRSIAGFSAMQVQSSTMEDALPQGVMIVNRRFDPEVIQVGHDITFVRPNDTPVTRRVISIEENYAGTGQRGFQTWGIMNPQPDEQMVPAANVVGLVTFSSSSLGQLVSFMQANILWIGILAILLIALMILLRVLLKKPEEDEEDRGEEDESAFTQRHTYSFYADDLRPLG